MTKTDREALTEKIGKFIEGRDPQERIVNLEYSYQDDFISVYYRDEDDNKCIVKEDFYPFLWATKDACRKLCNGDKNEIVKNLRRYGIKCVALRTKNLKNEVIPEIEKGYTIKFEAISPMSYSNFLNFFKICGNPVFSENKGQSQSSKQYLCITPKEQYLTSTGKRFFKGYDDYNDTLRLIFDLETEGLNIKEDRIEKVGIRFNRPIHYNGKHYRFEKIFKLSGETEEEKDISELSLIRIMLRVISDFNPDIIAAHNGEAFDWNIIMGACVRLGTTIEELSYEILSDRYITKDKRDTILKLGGEIETFKRTIVPGCIVTDSLHAVRRAQALDSNMLEANLKYVTKYSKMNKDNRVYVPGDFISKIGSDKTERYAFNNKNGDWYIFDENAKDSPEKDKSENKSDKFILLTKNKIEDGYELKSGEYIIDRYLLDDLEECDMVENRYNTPNFLICKMLPIPFDKCCTMGTAGQWKALLMAWSYENNLAIPQFSERKSFTGGLSRLLKVGFVKNVAKFDYNSLYPSITLTWEISDEKDLMGSMLFFLEFVLTQREKYKKLKKKWGKEKDALEEQLRVFEGTEDEKEELLRKIKKAAAEESSNDKKQLPLKILANSFFGSYGAPNVFPWGSLKCAERITCTGRQCLRLMISHFSGLGYQPIVGDSFTEDTPVFIRFKNGTIDIREIKDLINENEIKKDILGREYDYSEKEFQILSRSGWQFPSYIYRHKTDKDIFKIERGNVSVDVTEDHSLFNNKKEKIKPSDITDSTELEFFDGANELYTHYNNFKTTKKNISNIADEFISKSSYNERLLKDILNGTLDVKNSFLEAIKGRITRKLSKSEKAKLIFIQNCIKNGNV